MEASENFVRKRTSSTGDVDERRASGTAETGLLPAGKYGAFGGLFTPSAVIDDGSMRGFSRSSDSVNLDTTSPSSAVSARGAKRSVNVSNQSNDKHTVVRVNCRFRPGLLYNVLHALGEFDLDVVFIDFKVEMFALGTFHVRTKEKAKVPDNKTESLQNSLWEVVQGNFSALKHLPDTSAHIVVDVSTIDREGLLNDITKAIAGLGLNIDCAKIFTNRGKALDTFFVSDRGKRVEDEETFDKLKEVIGEAIHDPNAQVNVSNSVLEAALATREEAEAARVGRKKNQLNRTISLTEEGDDAILETYPKPEFVFAEQEKEEVQVIIDDQSNPDYILIRIHCVEHFRSVAADVTRLMSELALYIHRMKFIVRDNAIPSSSGAALPLLTLDLAVTDANGITSLSVENRNRIRRLVLSSIINPSEGISPDYSRVEVQSPDRPNLLKDVTDALKSLGLGVHQALIETVGDNAKNIFFVTDTTGHKINDKGLIGQVERAVKKACGVDSAVCVVDT
mmetsp:Transcript_26188/g.42915  ORF Transcript_26188/g.42915 Transcript_26188/m.42915 type:complete len:508 (-) Transcript_26188:57-1580(-)|eukprot:CAMPEP_0184643362 /NCGR_PEP_ID=MMETSP0308-20130426/197_1 /TAXON_ID=38269 /ORGANISM="Gloeochaete witrockiana, Strain SAG 46.84" /LENGTH=507 /DNA_ID=CAMNT_0027071247 /DNA_START=67 /DNA_END=1590 /DNA_ORIENTATION=-